MKAGVIWGFVTALLLVGFLGASLANPANWPILVGVVVGSFIFWMGYMMGFEDAE